MVSTPVWQAATSGHAGNAGHVNQFIGTHKSSFLYAGTLQSSQQTGNGIYTGSQGTYIYQRFTTTAGQTSVGTIQLQLNAVGGSPILELIPPISVGIYETAGNVPVGSPLAVSQVLSSYVYSSPFWVSIPIAATGLSPNTVYAIVTGSVGTATNYYAWQHSNQVTGGGVSTNSGVSWSIGAFGFMYRVYDTSVGGGSGFPLFIYDDDSARWTQFSYNANGSLASVSGRTAAQGGGFLTFSSSLTYSNGLLTGVS